MITWNAVRDYLRLALACAGFALIDPNVSKTLAWAPFPLPQMVSVLISALASYLVFALIDPLSRLSISWTDKADKIAATGPTLDVPISAMSAKGRIFAVEVERSSRSWLARWLFRKMVDDGLELVLDSNQDELRLVVERSLTATGDGAKVRFRLGAPDHRTSVSAADLSVNGRDLYADEVIAVLRYSVKTKGRWSSVSGFLVRTRPSIQSVRMIKAH